MHLSPDHNLNSELPDMAGFQAYLSSLEHVAEMDEAIAEDTQSLREDLLPVPWEEINSRQYSQQAWRIQNLIPRNGSTILASISGERKTWLALEMARCIAQGVPFLGDPRFAVEGGNVLYINAENAWNEIQRRGRQLDFLNDTPNKLLIVNSDDLNLGSLKGQTWFRAIIEYFDIEVVFVDTFRAVAGALKEEKAEEIRQFFNRFNSLKNKGISTVWLDHCRKPSNFDGKQPKKEHLLGSQDKTASVEVLLMIRSEPGSETIDVYQRKNRLSQEIKPFQILMRDSETDGTIKTSLTYGGDLDEQENKKDEAKELVLKVLEGGAMTTKVILEHTKKQVGSKNTRAALAELVNEGLIDVGKQHRENLYFLPKEEFAEAEKEVSEEFSNYPDTS